MNNCDLFLSVLLQHILTTETVPDSLFDLRVLDEAFDMSTVVMDVSNGKTYEIPVGVSEATPTIRLIRWQGLYYM